MLNRRTFLHHVSVATSLPFLHTTTRQKKSSTFRYRMRSLDGPSDDQVEVWRIPGRFTKNPDLVQFPSGKMMLVFCDVEKHWTEEISRITTLESLDQGKTWGRPRVVAEADKRKGEERWVTPRLSLLRDGRLVILCDHDDSAHYHEDQPPGNWIWFSSDQGRSWSRPRLIPLPGIEPDRALELKDGTLITGATTVLRDTQKEAMVMMRSWDGGLTWKDLSIVAQDKVQNYTEGGFLVLSNGLLACVMRNENHNGYPSFVTFSMDQGGSWSATRPLPFSGDRPYAKELSEGRVLITYRNRCGNRGTHAWIGDLTRAGYQIGGTHYSDLLTLESDSLHIHSTPAAVTRYILLPPESYRSDVVMEGTLRVDGPADQAVAAMEVSRLGIGVRVCSNALWLYNQRRADQPLSIEHTHSVNMSSFHHIRLQVRKGLARVKLDGKMVMELIVRDEMPLRETWFGRIGEGEGEIWWRDFTYHTRNPSQPDHLWSWQAKLGQHPDEYQIAHMLELHANPPSKDHKPDNGYSSWVELPDRRIFLVDYTNRGDPSPTAHLYGVYFSPHNFRDSGPD